MDVLVTITHRRHRDWSSVSIAKADGPPCVFGPFSAQRAARWGRDLIHRYAAAPGVKTVRLLELCQI